MPLDESAEGNYVRNVASRVRENERNDRCYGHEPAGKRTIYMCIVSDHLEVGL